MLTAFAAGLLAGLAALVVGPGLAKSTPYAEWVANAYANTAMQTVGRPAIHVGNDVDLSLRKRVPDREHGHQAVSLGDIKQLLTTVPGTTLRWGSRPFTFINGKFGTTFDLRDVLVGRRIVNLEHDGQMKVVDYIKDQEGRVVDLQGYVRAFVHIPDSTDTLSMDLGQSVEPITDGNEDATAWHRVREGVRRMFILHQEETGILRLALPVIALVGGLMAGYYLFGPGMLPGSPPGGRSVAVGATLLLIGSDRSPLTAVREWINAVPTVRWHQFGAGILGVALLGGGFSIDPVTTVAATAGVFAALFGLPLLSSAILSAVPGTSVPEAAAESWLTLGFKSLADPVIYQDDNQGVRVREGDGDGPRYRFCKTFVGFNLERTPDAFGEAGVKGSQLGEFRSEVATDGGVAGVPDGHEPTDIIANGGHLGFLPSFDHQRSEGLSSETFVRSDRWLARWRSVATGERSEAAHKEAIKEFADGSPEFSDRQIIMMSLGGAVAGLVASFALWGLFL